METGASDSEDSYGYYPGKILKDTHITLLG